MTTWPTIAATRLGRRVGLWASIPKGIGGVLTVGKLLAVASLPLTLAVYAWQLLPPGARRYRITNRRIVVLKGLRPQEMSAIGLDEFDAVRVEVLPGQEFHRSGDVLFLHEGKEVLRLAGVRRPEVFRRLCLEAQAALLGVRRVVEQQTPGPAAVSSSAS